MLPFSSKDSYRDDEFKPSIRIKSRIIEWIKAILSSQSSRNLFFFLLLNLSFAFVELAYGIWTNSLGLISDSFHMFFDCTALLAGLIASVISRWGKNERFSYGYGRAEVMAGFVNGLFLIFVAFFIFSEAVERALHPPEVKHERLFIISVLGLFVNLIGIFVFQHGQGDHGHSHGGHGHSHGGHGHSHGGHGHSHGHSEDSHAHNGHGHSHGEAPNNPVSSAKIMEGVFLHVLADTLGSVGVIISAILIHQFGWMLADPICSMFISVLIVFSVIPLIRDSTGILMQRTPKALESVLHIAYQRVNQIENVYSIQDPHFWTLDSENFIGTLRVLIAPNSDIHKILSSTHHIFNEIGVKHLYVQIEHSY
ncbi:zinc transporter 7-like [Actinia tenebrosa]|uniref:Zinc transporter 7-like n=1 Tax=Actinia tenebrosa TaxID=6105 RepID=A0A6P8HGM9_ACTTE|nr:zinc transporter 7-like [Actinia tenebrosa]